MRAPLAALCAALLCIPASLVTGYRIGQDDGPSALEAKLTAKTEAFFAAYNRGDGKAVCEAASGDLMGWFGPGSCVPSFSVKPGKADRMDVRVLSVTRVDGDSALVIIKAKGLPPATVIFELTRAAPAGDFRPPPPDDAVWELRKGKKAKRPFASWQIVGVV